MKPTIVAERIRHLMEVRQVPSIAEVERKAGVSRESMRQLLAGKIQNPRLDTVQNVAKYLETSVAYLVGETDNIEGGAKGATLYEEGKSLKDSTKINIPSWLVMNGDLIAICLYSGNLSPLAEQGDILIISPCDYQATNKIYAFIYKDRISCGFVSKNLDNDFIIKDASSVELGLINPEEIEFLGIAKRLIKSL